MCQENISKVIPENNTEDKIPDVFINNPEGYRIWLGFQELKNMSQEERDLLFEDDFIGGGCH